MPRKPPPIKLPARRSGQRDYLTEREIDRLVESAGNCSRTGLRDSLLIQLCYHYGLGPSELIAMTWQDVDLCLGRLLIHRKSGVMTDHSLNQALVEQLSRLREKAGSSGCVFESERGKGLSPRSVHNIVASAGRSAGLAMKVHPLLLKESRGISFFVEGGKKNEIQAFFGMKSTASVNEYLQDARLCAPCAKDSGSRSSGISRLMERSSTREPRVEQQIALIVPGSTCNLGPGLDTVGLALSLYSCILIQVFEDDLLHGPLVSITGEMRNQSTARDTGELVYTILAKLWSRQPGLLKKVKIIIDSEIPLGVGLGASDTAILAAVWASCHLAGNPLDQEELLGQCLAVEGNPENLAASLYGNMVVCARDRKRVVTQKLDWPEEWRVLIVSPGFRLTTPRSRSVLPARVPFEDAIFNLQRTSLMIAAVVNRDQEAFRFALADRMHEPYRCDLVPHLREIRGALAGVSHMGCVLSGGGSSVLVFAGEEQLPVVHERLQSWVDEAGSLYRVIDAPVDKAGMTRVTASP